MHLLLFDLRKWSSYTLVRFQFLSTRLISSFLCLDEEQLWGFHCDGQGPVRNVWSRRPQLSPLPSSVDRILSIRLLCLACRWAASEDGSASYHGTSQGRRRGGHWWRLFNLAERPVSEAYLNVKWKWTGVKCIGSINALSNSIDSFWFAWFDLIWFGAPHSFACLLEQDMRTLRRTWQTLISCAFFALPHTTEACRKWLASTWFFETVDRWRLSPPFD